MNCSDPAARSRGTFRGLAARLAAVFSRPCGCPDARALQGPARALCGRPLRLVFGRARDDRGLDRAALAHRPGLGLCFALVVASSWAGQKRRAAVKGRGAAKRSDVYPLRRTLFARLEGLGVRPYGIRGDRRGRKRPRAQAPTRALAGRPSTDRARGRGRAWGGGETGGASCRALLPPGWEGEGLGGAT